MRTQPSRLAFATITILLLLGLVTVALTAMVTLSRTDFERTNIYMNHAQMRQLLLSATIEMNHQASTWNILPNPQRSMLEMPTDDGSTAMDMIVQSPAEVDVRIAARLGQTRLTQQLRYRRTDSQWQLAEIIADPKPPTN